MANPYDISTVVSRSYISEHLQDQMQKGAENRGAEFIAQFKKESEKKGSAVAKAENSEKSGTVKRDEKREDGRGKNKNKRDRRDDEDENPSKIDIQA